MDESSYTFEAFLSDYAAMRHVLKYEHYTYAGRTTEIPEAHPDPLSLKLGDYMMQYPDQKTNMGYCIMIMAYAQRHAAELGLTREDLNCANQPPAKPLIFRAIHSVLLTGPEPPPEAVRELAASYEHSQPTQ